MRGQHHGVQSSEDEQLDGNSHSSRSILVGPALAEAEERSSHILGAVLLEEYDRVLPGSVGWEGICYVWYVNYVFVIVNSHANERHTHVRDDHHRLLLTDGDEYFPFSTLFVTRENQEN